MIREFDKETQCLLLSLIIFFDVLSHLFMKAKTVESIKGVKIRRAHLSISHLMFVDDLTIYAHANNGKATSIVGCLNQFFG